MAKAKAQSKPESFKKGDPVEWESSQGTVVGKVEKTLTEPTDIKGHHVAASDENPEILVKSDKTGAEAAHKPESLTKVKGSAKPKAKATPKKTSKKGEAKS